MKEMCALLRITRPPDHSPTQLCRYSTLLCHICHINLHLANVIGDRHSTGKSYAKGKDANHHLNQPLLGGQGQSRRILVQAQVLMVTAPQDTVEALREAGRRSRPPHPRDDEHADIQIMEGRNGYGEIKYRQWPDVLRVYEKKTNDVNHGNTVAS